MFLRTLVILCIACLGAAPPALAQWAIQNVDVGTSSGTSTSIGLTSGYPVISYFAAARNLRLATLDPQTKAWKLLNVDQGGEFSSLDVDAAGIVHVSYIDANARQIRYYRNNQGQGSIQIIDSETGSGGFSDFNSLRVDGNGVPRVSYYYLRSPDGSTSLDHLRYAQLTGSAWARTDADPTSGRGRYNSLALDIFGNPQIAYYEGNAKRLRIARRVAGVWSSQIVDSTAADPGRFNSIAVDLPTGFARISYVAATTQKVRYAAYNGATWTIEDVDGIGQVGSYDATSLRLDSNGNPHISYYNATAGALMYASKTGASWVVDTVDTQGDVGGYSSLVLDDQDRPVISYYDATNQALKIAYGPGYGDGDGDGVPDAFDVCPGNPDCNGNGIVDGLEGGILQGVGGTRLRDEPIFGCGSIGPFTGGGGGGSPPPLDLLFLLGPAAYLWHRRFRIVKARHT